MRHSGRMMVYWLLGTVLAAGAAEPEATELPTNPYQSIADRNVFGLKPIPVPVQPEAPKPPPPNIILSGITTIQGRKTAFLKTPPAAGKPGQPAKGDQYYMLSEGESYQEMKVLQIDEEAGAVKVSFSGSEIALNFAEHGAKPVAAPAQVAGQPGAIPAPGFRPPGSLPGATARPITLPTRTPRAATTPGAIPAPPATRLPSGSSVGNSQTGNFVQLNTGAGNVALPVGRAPTANTAPQRIPEVHNLPAEQQFLLIEMERERTAELVSRNLLPPLPPTPLTPPGSPGSVAPAVPGQGQMPH